jgi:hypothetical protein
MCLAFTRKANTMEGNIFVKGFILLDIYAKEREVF